MRVTGRVDCFGCVCLCVCPPDSKIKNCVLCVLMFMYYAVSYFTGIFYAVVRQISMLFIDSKDSVLFCSVHLVGSVYMLQSLLTVSVSHCHW